MIEVSILVLVLLVVLSVGLGWLMRVPMRVPRRVALERRLLLDWAKASGVEDRDWTDLLAMVRESGQTFREASGLTASLTAELGSAREDELDAARAELRRVRALSHRLAGEEARRRAEDEAAVERIVELEAASVALLQPGATGFSGVQARAPRTERERVELGRPSWERLLNDDFEEDSDV